MENLLVRMSKEENGGQGGTPPVEKTVEEKIAEAVKAKEDEWQSKYTKQVNEASKAERLKYEKELEKAKLTESERLAQEAKEEKERLIKENETLKNEKMMSVKQKALTDAKLPSYLINDNRLISAKEEEVAGIIKAIAKEHSEYIASVLKPTNSSTTPIVGNGSGKKYTAEDLAKMSVEEYMEWRKNNSL